MKRTLQSVAYLLIGMLVLAACADEKTGNASDRLLEDIDTNPKEVNKTTPIIKDTIAEDLEVVPPPPPPIPPMPEPIPWPPEPGPEPYPEPWPDPIPIPEPPPEPIPEPSPVDPILEFTDVEPEFPGGVNELKKFIMENVKYPEVDKQVGNQGRVYVEFVVEMDGSLSRVKVIRGVSEGLDKEAMRVVRLMPNWKPGEAGGKVVRCISRLPVLFRLD